MSCAQAVFEDTAAFWVPHQAAVWVPRQPAISLTPDAALVTLTVGVLLIYVELNRPGATLPGALGLLLSLLSVASLLRVPWHAAGLLLISTAAALLLLDLLRPTPVAVALAATVALSLGLGQLVTVPGGERLYAAIATVCGIVLGSATSFLTRIARRARANKAVD